jgi:hypothetical protein
MIEVFMEHSYGADEPKEVYCGVDRYHFIRSRILADFRKWRIVAFESDIVFFGAKLILDENLLTTEFYVRPALQAVNDVCRVGSH